MSQGIYTIAEIKQILLPILVQHRIKKAVLFGSYAKRNATAGSDVDLFIDSGGALNGLNFFEFYNQIENNFSKRVDLIEAIDVEKNSRIYNEINRHGLVLYEQE